MDGTRTMLELFKDCQVSDVATLEEFLNKYYKHDRFHGRGEEYADAITKSRQRDLDEDGIAIISRHDSVNGQVVAFLK